MQFFKVLFAAVGLQLFISSTTAQETTEVAGVIIDENNNGVDLALVWLSNPSDSAVVKSKYTTEDGSFVLADIPAGEYLLQVSLLGYTPHQETVVVGNQSQRQVLPAVVLKKSTEMLDAVTVSAKVPYVERKIDRTVVNVDALIANEGGDALEAIERAPGVTLDNEGNILLKGRSGFAIYINDKPSYLSGTDLQNYLKSLPAGTVKQIEIMTNPPAKYDAAGNAGVINIIIKKNKLKGVSGNASVGFRQGRYSNSTNSLNLNVNNNKVGFYGNFAAGFWNSYQDLNINRYYRDENGSRTSSFSQNSFGQNNGKYLNGTIGMDYYPSDNTTLGVQYKNNNSPTQRNIDNTARVAAPSGDLRQKVVADNVTDGVFQNEMYSVYANHQFDSTGATTLSINGDFVTYTSASEQDFKNFIYNSAGDLTFQDQIDGEVPSYITIYAAKTDFSTPLAGGKFDAGLKVAKTETDNEASYFNTVNGVTTKDLGLSNRFLYDEWINAGYVNYGKSIGRVGIQAGLRVENTIMDGHQLGNEQNADTSFTRNYTNAFPTFYATWQVDSANKHMLIFSYGKRIDRPFFQDLNPFISPLDKFTFYSGNPNLLPTFSSNYSLSHTFMNSVTTSLNYSKTRDGINETLEIQDSIYFSRPGNIANSESFSVSVQASLPITDWYRINTYMEANHRKFDSPLYTERLQSEGTFYYGSLTQSFTMKKGWSAELTGTYQSDLVYAQLLIKGYGQISAGVKKNILDGAGTLRLNVSDILKTRIGDGVINNLRLTDADWNSTFDSRRVSLAFSYRFGQVSRKQRRQRGSGSQDEQTRVKQ